MHAWHGVHEPCMIRLTPTPTVSAIQHHHLLFWWLHILRGMVFFEKLVARAQTR
jgi:hypothetical protein